MKILFWADGFWPRIGGAETYAFRFVQGMQKRGHPCLVLAQRDDPSWEGSETHKGISIERFDFDALIEKRDLKNIGSIKGSLERILREFQPDVIFLNTLARGSALGFLFFRKMFRVPVIASVHTPYWDAMPPLVKEICFSVDRICCVSNWVYSVMEKFLPSCKEKLRLVYYGLPIPELAPTPLPFSPPVILLLGRLSSEKGFDTAIEAFSLLQRNGSDAELLIIGSGPERPYLEHLALRGATQFAGEISIEAASSGINRATFVVMPSHFEAFGLVALESMQMQRPVIASAVGGLKEVIAGRETGLLVPPQDPLALYQAMEELLKQPKRAIEMGIQGRRRAMEKFSIEENLNQYEDLLQKAVGRGDPHRL